MQVLEGEIDKTIIRARDAIKDKFGLELSFIEQVALREIAISAVNDRERIAPMSYNGFSYALETAVRFMNFYYELPLEYAMVLAKGADDRTGLYFKDPERFKEFLRIKQAQRHYEE